MDGWDLVGQILLLITVAVSAGVVFEAIGVSAIIGYLLAGVLLGPTGLDLVGGHEDQISLIAELGVALLMFGIGLEVTPGRLKAFGWRGMLVGTLQICLTLATVTIASIAFGMSWRTALVLGAMIAMSSTAVVVRLLADRSELDAPHGRDSLAVLLTQDVAVVPMLILTGVLGGNQEGSAQAQLGFAVLGMIIIVGVLCFVGIVVLPRVLAAPILRRNRDLAIVLAISTCLVSAWGSHALGLSPALGAFVAGVLLARTSFARQIRADTSALRALFLTLFFASIGLLADLWWLGDTSHLLMLFAVVIGGLCIKLIATFLAIRLSGGPRRVGLESAICLAQFGEFSFVIGSLAHAGGILGEDLFQATITASFISLLATPLLVARCRQIAGRFQRMMTVTGIWKVRSMAPDLESVGPSGHVIVVGFGPAGEEATHLLQLAGLQVFVIDLNPISIQRAQEAGIKAMVGDASRRDIIEHAGIDSAAGVVVTIPDTEAAITSVSHIRTLNPDAIIVVRARYERRAEDIRSAGADHVISEESAVGTLLGSMAVSRVTGMEPVPLEKTEGTTAQPSSELE
ncbi:MAG: cation:proton antiporter [Phycisphaerales bacterium]|nr:cation:proton antiporter [Phycisphaerales bacterium]